MERAEEGATSANVCVKGEILYEYKLQFMGKKT